MDLPSADQLLATLQEVYAALLQNTNAKGEVKRPDAVIAQAIGGGVYSPELQEQAAFYSAALGWIRVLDARGKVRRQPITQADVDQILEWQRKAQKSQASQELRQAREEAMRWAQDKLTPLSTWDVVLPDGSTVPLTISDVPRGISRGAHVIKFAEVVKLRLVDGELVADPAARMRTMSSLVLYAYFKARKLKERK